MGKRNQENLDALVTKILSDQKLNTAEAKDLERQLFQRGVQHISQRNLVRLRASIASKELGKRLSPSEALMIERIAYQVPAQVAKKTEPTVKGRKPDTVADTASTGWSEKVKKIPNVTIQPLSWLNKASPEEIKSYLISLSPDQVKGLKNKKELARILNRRIKDSISSQDITKVISDFELKLNQNEQNSEIGRLFKELEQNLKSNFPGISIEEFFVKLFVLESAGNKKEKTARLFSGSGTGSWGIGQTVGSTYNNKNLKLSFNPFNPEEAIPGCIKFFLLAAFKNSRGSGQYKLARALDIYNKGAGGSKKVPDSALLNPRNTRKDKYGNPYNYAYHVLHT